MRRLVVLQDRYYDSPKRIRELHDDLLERYKTRGFANAQNELKGLISDAEYFYNEEHREKLERARAVRKAREKENRRVYGTRTGPLGDTEHLDVFKR